MTTAEAAALTGRDARHIRRLAATGRIPGAVRVVDDSGGRLAWDIPASWANDPANRNRGVRGRPKRAKEIP